MINRCANVGDKVIYKDAEGKNTFGVIKEVAVRHGLNEYGFIKSEDDYVILENGEELDYKDGFNVNEQLEALKEYNKMTELRLKENDTFKKKYSYKYNFGDSCKLNDRIAKNEVIIAALEYFETIKDNDYSVKVNDYINLEVRCWNGGLSLGFNLSDKIESDMYEYVWSSHSDLFNKTDKLFREMLGFIFEIESKEWVFEELNNKDTDAYIIKRDSYVSKGVENLKEIIRFLKSPKMEPINKMIIEYFDTMVAIGKKRDEESVY